jgi:hypothetical protein
MASIRHVACYIDVTRMIHIYTYRREWIKFCQKRSESDLIIPEQDQTSNRNAHNDAFRYGVAGGHKHVFSHLGLKLGMSLFRVQDIS